MVNREQADEAHFLVQEATDFAELVELAKILPPDIKASLRAAHRQIGNVCRAHGEGLVCCIDVLLEDPGRYAPERVAAARTTLRHYNEGKGT